MRDLDPWEELLLRLFNALRALDWRNVATHTIALLIATAILGTCSPPGH